MKVQHWRRSPRTHPALPHAPRLLPLLPPPVSPPPNLLAGTRLIGVANKPGSKEEFGAFIIFMGIQLLKYDLATCALSLTLSARRWSLGGISIGAPISPPRPAAGMEYSLLQLAWVNNLLDEGAELQISCMRERWYERLYGMTPIARALGSSLPTGAG